MMPFMDNAQAIGLRIRWQKYLLCLYNRQIASLSSVPEEDRDHTYQEALQYKAALEVVAAMAKQIEPNWEDNREELEYYHDWEIGDQLFSGLPTDE